MQTAPTAALLKQPRWVWLLIAGAVALLLLSLLLAPGNSWQQSGSTYNKAPDGYAAWYEYMEKRGVKLERSRQPLTELIAAQQKAGDTAPKTLLQIQPQLTTSGRWASRRQSEKPGKLPAIEQTWLAAGNHLIILGVTQPVRQVSFSSRIPSPVGPVKVETGRRATIDADAAKLRDRAGAIVWEVPPIADAEKPAKPPGRLIYATTPHLGANAYQGEAGNYAFLADLVTQSQTPVIIDEYLHGYRDPEPGGKPLKGGVPRQERPPAQSLLGYFAQTPLLPIGVQAIVLMVIAIWARNRRFGRVKSVDPPPVDNSTAYIQALAGALRQANSRSFVMETVNQAELRQLQRQLGFGDTPMTLPELIEAWTTQPQSTADLKSLLRLQSRGDLSDRDLLLWLQSWQRLREGVK
jgi:Domain of unknown function (DUF4350)